MGKVLHQAHIPLVVAVVHQPQARRVLQMLDLVEMVFRY
jgi:hypothetical protein|tara:strand:+ start:322 stop:438 length:117 start_codon:yes stop_codon:yes gene_type:complete